MKSFRVYGLTCILMLLAGAAAQATTIVLPTDAQLIAKSSFIVEGTVVSTKVVDVDGRLYTDTVVSVERARKGNVAADTITVREIGGETEERVTKIFGAPQFVEGERVLLFLEESPRGGYRTMDLFAGKFSEAHTMNGRRLWFRDPVADEVTLLDASFREITATNVQRDAEGFETFVEDRVAGRSGLTTYGIENPVLRKTAAPQRIEANFELISEPTIYRWFRFASGQSAQWYSMGTQTGYTGGGVNELQTAMDAWNGYAEANIRYSYSGTRSGSMGGLDNPNGVNEVLFNDPLNEIAGTFTKGAGGVVGIGGFNGVSAKQNWTAPFGADAEHTAGTKSAWNITEGNLSIQDGVTPGNGLSSNRLAEIVSHEFGHTLGFGHSASSSALMYNTVTGIGPHLRADDQLAARWLYPNGSGTPGPTRPAAPSSLTAVASSSSISLTWKDNSTDETSFAIYLSSGGAYSQATTTGVNATGATLNGLSSGTYSIYVVARNGAGDSPQSNVATATIAMTPAVASFKATFASGTTYNFEDTSSGTILSREWSFGDGQRSTQANPTHTYANPGQYTVRLTLNGSSATSVTKTINVSVLAAIFVHSPAQPTTNDTVTFTDQSTGSPVSWNWVFGDGTSSTTQSPSKRYGGAGTYTVTLTVRRANGETASTSKGITVGNGSPVTPNVVAAFDASTVTPAAGANVAFTDRSAGAPTQWSWSFGDGKTSTAQHPVHAYAGPGTYTVSLTATNAKSSSTATKQINVSPILSFRTLVSVAAQTSGVGGTSWRTELNVFNAGAQGANVTFIFIPTAGGTAVTRNLFLSPRQSATYANALLDLFGIPSGAGAMAIEASSAGASADLRVTSRTFTGSSTGTYGQSVPDVQSEALTKTLYVTGIAANAAFRTNVGIVNRSAEPVAATFTLHNNNGSVVATKNVSLAANSFQQSPLATLFPEITGSVYDVLTMRIGATVEDAVSAYASIVDNDTQDPVYVQATAAPSGNALTIPVVGRAPGANGTFWRSDVTLFNPTTSSMTLTLRYGSASRTITLGGMDTDVLRDVLAEFDQTSGSGTLRVSWSGSVGPVVTSRTYTSVTAGGTYGQSIEPVAAFGNSMYVPGLRNDSSYRSNVGFVNGGTETEVVTVRLLSSTGTQIGQNTLTLAPNAQLQYAVTALFPGVNATGFTLQVTGDTNAKVFAYGSMVDNKSGDPVFFAGR